MPLRQIARLWSRVWTRSHPAAPLPTQQDDAAGLGTAYGLEVSLALQAEPEPPARPRAGHSRQPAGKPSRR